MIIGSIAALFALAQPLLQTPSPAPNLWVAYNVGVSNGGTTPTADGQFMVTHGGGAQEIFAVRLRRSSRDRLAGDVSRPANYDRHELSEVVRDRPSDDPYSEANRQMGLLQEALRHHQPAVGLSVRRGGGATRHLSSETREHRRCARRLLRAAMERRLASAENEFQREAEQERLDERQDRRLAAVEIASPILLLRLLLLDLQPVASGYWTGLHRRLDSDQDGNRRPTQFEWRGRQIQGNGREFALRIDLLRDRTSPAARACLTLRPRGATSPVTDGCTIDAVVDQRDGWPIAISVARHIRGANGADVHDAKSFSRLTPLEGFAAPPDPCRRPIR